MLRVSKKGKKTCSTCIAKIRVYECSWHSGIWLPYTLGLQAVIPSILIVNTRIQMWRRLYKDMIRKKPLPECFTHIIIVVTVFFSISAWIQSVLWIRIRNEFEVKLLWKTGIIRKFLNKNAQFKHINSFLSKKYSPKKLMSRHNEQPNTITIRKNLCRIRNRIRIRSWSQLTSRIRIGKKSLRIDKALDSVL